MEKCVIILDENLPLGLQANASAVLGATIGKMVDGIIGNDIIDASNEIHPGITNTVMPILKTSKDELNTIRNKAKGIENITVIDFSDVAQRTRTYEDYSAQLQNTRAKDLRYVGIALYGENKKVNKLSGSLPLLR